MKKFLSLAVLLGSLVINHVESGFSNHGKWQSDHLNLVVNGTLENDGELSGVSSATLCCETLTGSGLIKAPQIIIKAKAFAFCGKIDCSEKCLIIVSHLFDETMFERSGGGEFIILYDTTQSVINLNTSITSPKPTIHDKLTEETPLFIEGKLS